MREVMICKMVVTMKLPLQHLHRDVGFLLLDGERELRALLHREVDDFPTCVYMCVGGYVMVSREGEGRERASKRAVRRVIRNDTMPKHPFDAPFIAEFSLPQILERFLVGVVVGVTNDEQVHAGLILYGFHQAYDPVTVLLDPLVLERLALAHFEHVWIREFFLRGGSQSSG